MSITWPPTPLPKLKGFQMNSMIEFVIDHGMTVASSKVSTGDVACGVLGALRRVRGVVQEVGDPNALSLLDSGLRDRLIVKGLRGACRGETQQSVALPETGPGAGIAETIMTNAVDYCLTVVAHDGRATDVFRVAVVLLDRLMESLNGVPDLSALLAQLTRNEEAYADAAYSDGTKHAYLN